MFIKRTVSRRGDKTYVNHLLVESVTTPSGPRHRVVCNLGKLDPGPKEEWLELAERIQSALAGQPSLFKDARVDEAVARVRARSQTIGAGDVPVKEAVPAILPVKVDGVQSQDLREAGPVHVGHQMWQRLRVDAALKAAGLSAGARALTEVMALNRLVAPCSERAMVDWARRTAVPDILGQDTEHLHVDRFYRNLDKLHGKRAQIEAELHDRERSLFNLDGSLVLYDLTNTYFEGQVLGTPKAQRGHSKEKRSDCKLVSLGLMLDGDGFPIGHEVFAGNTPDGQTVADMLDALEHRTGRMGGSTVVMDRGMASAENLEMVRTRQHHYLVAGFQNQRSAFQDEFESLDGWTEIEPSAVKAAIQIKRIEAAACVYLLCTSPARAEKDRAIREKQETRLLKDLEKLAASVAKAAEPMPDNVLHERIGRLRERYARAARYYRIERQDGVLAWTLKEDQKRRAETLDGAYFLKTSRRDLGPEEIWRTYITLTRIEAAFRDLKGTLDLRPVFHRKECRVETHIFLCVLAYHLQAAIEHTLIQAGDHTAWETLRQELSTHQTLTVVLPTADGRKLAIRKGSIPDARPREIYRLLAIPADLMKPLKTWV